MKLQLLSTQIQEADQRRSAAADAEPEIEDYYDAAKDTQFTTAESRDVRAVVNKDKAKVEAAKAALEETTRRRAGKGRGQILDRPDHESQRRPAATALTEELLVSQPTLKTAIFEQPDGELVGPVKIQANYYRARGR